MLNWTSKSWMNRWPHTFVESYNTTSLKTCVASILVYYRSDQLLVIAEDKHPYSMMLPPPCLKGIWYVFVLGWCAEFYTDSHPLNKIAYLLPIQDRPDLLSAPLIHLRFSYCTCAPPTDLQGAFLVLSLSMWSWWV